MKPVYTAATLIDGQLVVDLLQQAGIPCLLFNQNAVGALGDLPVTHPEVWVKRDADADTARRAISDFENTPPPPTNQPCPTCDEQNPATFEVCWQCNSPLAAGATAS